MRKVKLNAKVKRIILREFKKQSYLGVRQLSSLLKEKYNLSLSKTLIHEFISAQGLSSNKGRKKARSFYPRRGLIDPKLILLRGLGTDLGLFDYLSQELKVYLPKLSLAITKRIIILLTLASFYKEDVKTLINKRYFLKAMYALAPSSYWINCFLERISQVKPQIDLSKFKTSISYVSTVRFNFRNGLKFLCDPKFFTFWPDKCWDYSLYSPLSIVKHRLIDMLKDNCLMFKYTKSFDYLSGVVVKFISSVRSGINKIEFLGEDGRIIEVINYQDLEFSKEYLVCYIGFYPKLLLKSMVIKDKNFKIQELPDSKSFYSLNSVDYLQPNNDKVNLDTIFITKNKKLNLDWAIVINKKEEISKRLKQYLYRFPQLEESFKEHLNNMQDYYKQSLNNKILDNFIYNNIADSLVLDGQQAFDKIVNILMEIFNSSLFDLSLIPSQGYLVTGDNYYKMVIPELSLEIKNKVNAYGFYFRNKRIIFI